MEAQQLVERYVRTWNETDAEARRSAIEGLWAEHGRYVDPLADVTGHDQIVALIAGVQAKVEEQAPGCVFRLMDGLDAHHDVMRFRWELVPESGGEPVAIGFDVAVTDEPTTAAARGVARRVRLPVRRCDPERARQRSRRLEPHRAATVRDRLMVS